MKDLKLDPPGKTERLRVLRKAVQAARDEAGDQAPFIRMDGKTGEKHVVAAAYQQYVAKVLARWLDAFVAVAVPLLTGLRGEYQEQRKVVVDLQRRLDDVNTRVRDPLKLGGHGVAALIGLFLAGAVNLALTYGVIERLGWPITVTLVAAVALVAIEVAVTGLVGRGLAALALDKPGTPFDLEPRERRQMIAQTGVLGAITLAYVIALGLARGGILWILAGLIGAALGVWLGGAFYEARFHRERDELEGEVTRARRLETTLLEVFNGAQEQVLQTGLWLRDEAALILARADTTFTKAFRHARRNDAGATVPVIPDAPLPDPEEIRQRLIVALDGRQQTSGGDPGQVGVDHEAQDGEVGDEETPTPTVTALR